MRSGTANKPRWLERAIDTSKLNLQTFCGVSSLFVDQKRKKKKK
jgi:hypothetical protein